MGVHCHYQAMSETCTLYTGLQADRRLLALYQLLLHQPSGPNEALSMPAEELTELLDDIARTPDFGGRTAVDQAVAEFRTKWHAESAAAPDLERRRAYLKLNDEMDFLLASQFRHLGHPEPEEFTWDVINGFEPLSPDLESDLRVVPTQRVAVVADCLSRMQSSAFGWLAEDFEQLRWVYTSAGRMREAVLVGA